MVKWDLAWGNSVCVREAFLDTYNQNPVLFLKSDLMKFNYPKHEGDPELVEITRKVIKRQVGLDYKHVYLTNGATGGVVITLRAYQNQGKKICVTRDPPFYVRYPSMIKTSGLSQRYENDPIDYDKKVILLDVPSNPLGLMDSLKSNKVQTPIVLDGVYYNNVYTNGNIKSLPHDVMIGSYSKLLGINGIRVGWIATNDDLLAERIKELITSEYCGLSMASTEILKSSLYGFNWANFENSARWKLDANREEWSKLERFFDYQEVSPVGMFYYAMMDQKCRELFTKAGIKWTDGESLGTNFMYGRFNLGQDNQSIEDAVKEVLKIDKI